MVQDSYSVHSSQALNTFSLLPSESIDSSTIGTSVVQSNVGIDCCCCCCQNIEKCTHFKVHGSDPRHHKYIFRHYLTGTQSQLKYIVESIVSETTLLFKCYRWYLKKYFPVFHVTVVNWFGSHCPPNPKLTINSAQIPSNKYTKGRNSSIYIYIYIIKIYHEVEAREIF